MVYSKIELRVGALLLAVTCCTFAALADDRAGAKTPGTPGMAAIGAPAAAPRFDVRTGIGVESFLVDDPGALESAAWRLSATETTKDGQSVEPQAGFRLTNRVIVVSVDPAGAEALCATYGLDDTTPLFANRGVWTGAAATVANAIARANELASDPRCAHAGVDVERPKALRSLPTDPNLHLQWHLHNTTDPLFDVNAEPAWTAGYTGSGVIVGIVEGGWEHTHSDLAANYNATASTGGGGITSHATSCAGVVAEVGNNGLWGAGIAYNAEISDCIYGTDAQDANALTFRSDLNDIKSNSWGPSDDGRIDYLPAVVQTAFEESITLGRGGLGEIIVWAGGNGASSNDRVDYDQFAASRYTIAVGAIGDDDRWASYSEPGASLTVCAHSRGNSLVGIYTTSIGGMTTNFGGTSAACPLAAGTVALMLEADPYLTWRDVQHVLIESARTNDPNDVGWFTNAAGFDVSDKYGHGAVDAGAAVALTEVWEHVAHEVSSAPGVIAVDELIPDNDPNGLVRTVEIVDNIRLESVELIINLTASYAGDYRIELTGPSGTESLVAKERSDTTDGYQNFTFTSVRHWGESSVGTWTVRIADRVNGDTGTWDDFELRLYGTPMCPGDFDGSGGRDFDDLNILLAAYGTCDGDAQFEPAADFDNNGCVDFDDLNVLLSVYGTDCP